MRLCTKCGEIKPVSAFYDSHEGRYRCKSCVRAYRRERSFAPMTEGVRVCPGCGQEKALTEYHAHRRNKDGRARRCRECASRDSEDRMRYEPLMDGERVCEKCGETKLVSAFYVSRSRIGGREPVCADCNRDARRVGDGGLLDFDGVPLLLASDVARLMGVSRQRVQQLQIEPSVTLPYEREPGRMRSYYRQDAVEDIIKDRRSRIAKYGRDSDTRSSESDSASVSDERERASEGVAVP